MKDHLRGAYTNKDTGEKIEVSNVGINEVLSHGTTNESHMRSLAAIPRMLENSIFIDEAANSKGNSKYDRYRYYAVGLRINGEDYTAKLVVGVKNGARYYDHRLTQIEKGALIDSLNRHSNSVAENQAPDMSGISNALSSVLQVNSSKIVDENGEPLVVWHGTDADFTVFDRAKARATMDIQGNFFSPWEDDARGYGSNVRRFFLNLRNPADENTGYHSLHEFEGQNGAGVKARERLVALGYDGVNNGGEEFIAFSPEQIKSATENVGTFDAGNPDIRYSLGGGTRVLRAWHGSPHEFDAEEGAPFGRFGLSFVGTGEGGQAFGYGIYLTSEEDIARHNYAQRLGDDDTAAAQRALGRFGLAWATFRADELAACVSFSDFKRELRAAAWSLEDLVEEGEMTAEELASDKASIREATKTREAFDALLSAMLATQDYFYESRREDLERALEEAGEGRKAKALREELERFDELKREADANERPRHHLYEARIRVADDASNLLDWVARPSEEQLERIRAGLRERGVSEEAAVRLTAAGSFGEIYRSISEELGGAAKASETLKAAGFAGHKYPADSAGTGAADYSRGTNYVIYDTGATEITDAVRWSLVAAEQAAWDEVLDAYEAGRLPARGMVTVLPRTPAVLQRCGAANLPLKISKGVLDKVTKEKHGVPVRELRGLLVNLDNPIAVFRSRTQADSLVVLTELRDEANGNNAVVAVRLDAKADSEHEINAIASIYGKSPYSIDGMLRDGLALYAHTQKIRAYLRSSRLQLPAETSRRGSSPLLTQDDFTQDELGVVKVNNKILRNSAGVVYGYWDEGSGELHLNEDFADFDTPLHEWAHVWLSWVRKADARLAERALAVTKETRFYKRLREDKGSAYAGLSDDALAEEAFAMLCGKDGGVPVLRVSSVAFDFAENFLQAANRGEGIVVPADGAHDGKVPRAGAEHGGQPRFVDPADGDGGTRRGVDHRAHGLQAQRRIGNFLGRRGVDGADADVVGSGGTRGSRLRERMRGEPENFQRREAFPCGGQRHVVLPEMHAVGLRFRGDFRIVVHDEERARSRSDAANVFRGFDDAFPRRALHAQLNETQACAHGCVRAGFITRRGIRDDEVKAEGIFHEEKKKKRGSAGIARGIPWRSRRRFSALQIFGDDARELASAFEHAAENRPHAEAALYVVRRHARGVKPGEQALRIFDGRAFAVFHPHGFFAENAAGGRIDFHAGLVHGLLNDFARVSRAVDDGARRDDDGVDVHVEPPHRVPVDDDAGNHAVVENDVLDADCVENDRSRLARAENQPRRHFDGIERLVAVPERNRRDAEVVKNFRGVVLHDDFVHQHAAAPNAAAGRELAFVNGDFEARLRKVARGDEPARSRADDGDVHREIAFELFEKRAHDGARNLFFHDHGFCFLCFFFCVESKMNCPGTAPAGTRFPRSGDAGGFLFPQRVRAEKKTDARLCAFPPLRKAKKKTCRPEPELVSSSFPFSV